MASDEIILLFDTAPRHSAPIFRPKGGTSYVYTWDDDRLKNDWRADGYRWRQNGTRTAKSSCGINMQKTYFRVSVHQFTKYLDKIFQTKTPSWVSSFPLLISRPTLLPSPKSPVQSLSLEVRLGLDRVLTTFINSLEIVTTKLMLILTYYIPILQSTHR